MSVNESTLEQPEDAADLPDLYNRELNRKKNTYTSCINSGSDGGGGYSDWKARNGMNASERMMSSLGKAIHNQGIISMNDKDFPERNNFIGAYANSLPGEYNVKDHHNMRLNASEPSYTPHQFRQHSGEMPYRNGDQSFSRGEIHEHQNGRPYNGSSRDNSEAELISEQHYSPKCMGQCCTNKTIKSPMNLPQNHQGSQRNRESTMHNRNLNTPKIQHGDYHCQNTDSIPNHSSLMNQGPSCGIPNQYHHNFMYPQCHIPQPTCHCYQNQNETPRQAVSPHKKCTVNRKTESSIKKLFRILWLQNEQLGLLERQVSKLIEVNFSQESSEKSTGKVNVEDKSANVVETVTKKIETCEVGVMTDLPCVKCSPNEKKTSSESEPEISNKPPFEDSLTLFGVEIPVNGEEISSPPVSMHIDMQEFQDSSSSETDESDTTEDEREPVGWTFYDNVVGQVNNILKSANKKKNKKKSGYTEEINLAVEQLKRLGIPLPEHETNHAKRVTFEQGLKEQQINLRAQSEISMNFNALASKYLSSAGAKVQDISMCNVISSNSNMSMATMRYLERHQIANRDEMTALPKKNPGLKTRTSKHSGEKAVSKFLDITAIRQQPKLLPKDI